MERDSYIQLRHAYTGDMKKGYYGFSRDSFWSAGLVWLRRDTATCLDYMSPLLGTIIACSAVFLIPSLSAELEGNVLTVGDVDISGHALFGLIALFAFLFQNTFIASFCNRRYTRKLLQQGYLILPGVNEQEARKALRLEDSDAGE